MNKKIFFISIFALVVGSAGGYFYGNKNQKTVPSLPCVSERQEPSANIPDTKKIALKLGLLKDYTDFVLLPSEEIADPVKYADDMGEKVKTINDSEITIRFYATGEATNKEQKIVDFLDYLSESIKSDLQ